jgi:hypothetical protein
MIVNLLKNIGWMRKGKIREQLKNIQKSLIQLSSSIKHAAQGEVDLK